ncbi:hypothetical protein U1Q18_030552 [Sarracenia purpurea var. burkii]
MAYWVWLLLVAMLRFCIFYWVFWAGVLEPMVVTFDETTIFLVMVVSVVIYDGTMIFLVLAVLVVTYEETTNFFLAAVVFFEILVVIVAVFYAMVDLQTMVVLQLGFGLVVVVAPP